MINVLVCFKTNVCTVDLYVLHVYSFLLTQSLKQRYEMKFKSDKVAVQVDNKFPQPLKSEAGYTITY